MINQSGAGSTAAMAFPDPPTGDPGGIAAAARTLHQAADDLETAHGELRGATGQIEGGWRGFAADGFHRCSQGLGSVASAGAQEFRDCATAVSGYGTALDHAQTQITRLRLLYEDALRRQAAALNLAQHLAGTITAHTKPGAALRTQTQVTNCQTQAGDALTEADGYAIRANAVKTDFAQTSSRYAAVLDGGRPGHGPNPLGSPFSATGHAGPGFGAPFNNFSLPGSGSPGPSGLVPSGLSAFDGTFQVGPDPQHSDIPGYEQYWTFHHENLSSPDDLTNLIAFVASFGAAGAVKDLGGAALKAIVESFGVGTAGREAATGIGNKVIRDEIEKVLESGATKSEPLSKYLPGANDAGRTATQGMQAAQRALRVQAIKQGIDVIGQIRPLPTGVADSLKFLVEHGSEGLKGTLNTLVHVRASLGGSGTAAGRAVTRVIETILRSIGR